MHAINMHNIYIYICIFFQYKTLRRVCYWEKDVKKSYIQVSHRQMLICTSRANHLNETIILDEGSISLEIFKCNNKKMLL